MKNNGKILLAFGALAAWALICKNNGVSGIGSAKKFYVYAGYYENVISTEPLPEPFVLRRTCRTIENAIKYAESFGDTVTFCENVKYDLPDYLYDYFQDHDYEYAKYDSVGKVNPNRNGTRVIFRVFKSGVAKGEVIAVFPDESWTGGRDYASYMHNGQHGAADYSITSSIYTRPATPKEYTPLLRELEQIGYDDLVIAQRV